MKIALCGCMTQEESVIDKICTSYRFTDLIFGTHNIYRFAEYLYYMYEGNERRLDEDNDCYYKGNTLISRWDYTEKICENLPIERKYIRLFILWVSIN